jgi:UDP-N-acetylglucosamine--N-acetylmuramyl-(pentapeptide) pyrophosphoryl-undecaprenol N-acetylglucosamine transferase
MTQGEGKKILVMAGGTGGHIFPALAVADALKNEGWQVCWLGTPGRMEATLVPEHGYPIEFIDVVGVRGNGLKRLLLAPFMVLRSILQALKVIKSFKPDVVIGFGGFASGPGGIAAWLKRIPLVLHEQNAVAGFTNKILARFASKVLMAFPDTLGLGSKAQLVGNPIRQSIVELASKPRAQQTSTDMNILVVGGSLGAKVLNDEIPFVLSLISYKNNDTNVRHQTGKSGDGVADDYAKSKLNPEIVFGDIEVVEFIDDMAQAYDWADFVVCRAGALTVAEVAAAGVPALFVPYPHAVDDHQTRNAQWLVDARAALIVQQKHLRQISNIKYLQSLLSQPQVLNDMAQNARDIAILDATEQVASECKKLVNTNE